MSKVICDVCGTSYPDTATQCPICGYVRTGSAQSEETRANGKQGYTYVKGGRFSKSNVKNRNHSNGTTEAKAAGNKRPAGRRQEMKNSGNKGLVITAIVLLILIISLALFITFRYFVFADLKGNEADKETVETTAADDEENPEESQAKTFSFEKSEITFTEAGETQDIYITPLPADDDILTVSSSDDKVATAVIRSGVVRVTAMGPGEAVIRLTYDTSVTECKVICNIEKEIQLKANIELSKVGATEDLLINRDEFTEEELAEMEWTSSDSSVVKVKDGIVTAEKEGSAEITVKYGDQELKRTVNCLIKDESLSTGNAELDNSVTVGTGGGIGES